MLGEMLVPDATLLGCVRKPSLIAAVAVDVMMNVGLVTEVIDGDDAVMLYPVAAGLSVMLLKVAMPATAATVAVPPIAAPCGPVATVNVTFAVDDVTVFPFAS